MIKFYICEKCKNVFDKNYKFHAHNEGQDSLKWIDENGNNHEMVSHCSGTLRLFISQSSLVRMLKERLSMHKKNMHSYVREINKTKASAFEDEAYEILSIIKDEE